MNEFSDQFHLIAVNLYGYGYRHVYELNAYVSVDDPRLSFAGTAVEGG